MELDAFGLKVKVESFKGSLLCQWNGKGKMVSGIPNMGSLNKPMA